MWKVCTISIKFLFSSPLTGLPNLYFLHPVLCTQYQCRPCLVPLLQAPVRLQIWVLRRLESTARLESQISIPEYVCVPQQIQCKRFAAAANHNNNNTIDREENLNYLFRATRSIERGSVGRIGRPACTSTSRHTAAFLLFRASRGRR